MKAGIKDTMRKAAAIGEEAYRMQRGTYVKFRSFRKIAWILQEFARTSLCGSLPLVTPSFYGVIGNLSPDVTFVILDDTSYTVKVSRSYCPPSKQILDVRSAESEVLPASSFAMQLSIMLLTNASRKYLHLCPNCQKNQTNSNESKGFYANTQRYSESLYVSQNISKSRGENEIFIERL